MALPIYLAMTALEYERCQLLPKHPGWMACHFSSCGDGLSNVPQQFPKDGILMVNDEIPPTCHSSDVIAQQLLEAVDIFAPQAVVLDFQRPFQQILQDMAQSLNEALPCPVVLTPSYCKDWSGSVLLPPLAPHKSLAAYLQPWQGKHIWLELSNAGQSFLLTKTGCQLQTMHCTPAEPVFRDDKLFCHYCSQVLEDHAIFSLWRTEEDLSQLLQYAEGLGVTAAVGLYQEFHSVFSVLFPNRQA